MKNEYEILKAHYGNHSVVAKKIGITARYYRCIRSGRLPSKALNNLIKQYVLIAKSNDAIKEL